MAGTVLYQYGDDPFAHHFKDHEGRVAFTIAEASRQPNIIIRLTRELVWSKLHPNIMGPDNSFFYFGPERRQGQLAYGGNNGIHMAFLREQKREGSPSRYFRAQNRKEYKWRIINTYRMELLGGGTLLATWEITRPEQHPFATLTLHKDICMTIITEIVTTLTLNRMASELGW
ncbi:hypothetical protein BDQ17DRAFT_1424751 [Cyathus striatus]|nr:hypothetical protein BDQ17DRAFT_1424751 [Cyathus striatus]